MLLYTSALYALVHICSLCSCKHLLSMLLFTSALYAFVYICSVCFCTHLLSMLLYTRHAASLARLLLLASGTSPVSIAVTGQLLETSQRQSAVDGRGWAQHNAQTNIIWYRRYVVPQPNHTCNTERQCWWH